MYIYIYGIGLGSGHRQIKTTNWLWYLFKPSVLYHHIFSLISHTNTSNNKGFV